jgi:hypothetical protein
MVFFLGMLIGALGVVVLVISWRRVELYELVGVALVVSLGLLGIFLMYATAFGTTQFFDRVTRYVDIDADWVGLILIVVLGAVAVPVTYVVKRIKGPGMPRA